MILSKTLEQENYKIMSVNVENNMKLKLLSLGIYNLSEIIILRNNRGDVVIGLNHARIALDKNISQHIEVER